jgi:chromosome segregation ATPase
MDRRGFRFEIRRLQFLPRLAAASALVFCVAAPAYADDAASLRQQLDALTGKIAQIDADIAGTAHGIAEVNDESATYAASLKASTATGEELKQRSQQLATRRAELDNERDAAEQTCRKTTATAQEYQAALAQCEAARQTYQQNLDSYSTDQRRLADDLATYDAASRKLQAEYKDIEQKRRGVLARQASLEDTRQQMLDQFNEIRDRLIALQSNPK